MRVLHASEQGRHVKVLRAVASIELIKGLAVFAGGCSLLLLINKDPWDIVDGLLRFLHINPDRQFAQILLDWADSVTDSKLWWVAGFAFAYSALRFVEAYGLWKARIWAEWLALVSGALYLPLEILSIRRKPDLFRFAILGVNIAVVAYMAYLRSTSQRRMAGTSHHGLHLEP